MILLLGLSQRALKMMVQPSTPRSFLRRLHSVSEPVTESDLAIAMAPSLSILLPLMLWSRDGHRMVKRKDGQAGVGRWSGDGHEMLEACDSL